MSLPMRHGSRTAEADGEGCGDTTHDELAGEAAAGGMRALFLSFMLAILAAVKVALARPGHTLSVTVFTDRERNRQIHTDVYEPNAAAPAGGGPRPLVIYAHGKSPAGDSRENVALLQTLANSGYRVYAPNIGHAFRPRDEDYVTVGRDINTILDAVEHDPKDTWLIGMSRGGGGVMRAVEARGRLGIDDVTGAIAFGPRGHTVGHLIDWPSIIAPVALVLGSNDGITPYYEVSARMSVECA